ncbi:hypothetical protein AVEN_263352-1 [Araneus ventricosus]|uniref:Uncharacterized protein n=1 Tax=Araneus ventricosus TaxID=182803 RepID=A0A4Y2D2A3_ARAVE|nr:hypothetical protein AVEN_263352-1 [Araneus ventricosus]
MVTSELSLTCCKLTASLHTCHDKFVANLHSCHDKFVASLLQTKIAIWDACGGSPPALMNTATARMKQRTYKTLTLYILWMKTRKNRFSQRTVERGDHRDSLSLSYRRQTVFLADSNE